MQIRAFLNLVILSCRSQTKENEEAVETMKGYSSQQTLDDGDDELKRIIEESRSRRRRMKEEMFSNP